MRPWFNCSSTMELAIDAVDNEYGQTPLSWATKKGHEAVLRLLLYKGATVDVVDKSGRTPLSWDAERGHEATARLLLYNGAVIDVVDNRVDQTPLSWAAESGLKAIECSR